MYAEFPIITPRLILRTLSGEDATPTYLSWLHNPKVTEFLEIRFAPPQSTLDLMHYIESTNQSEESLLLGIFLRDGHRHIGNIKLGPIISPHKRGDIGLLIGDSDQWGKGLATEAISGLRDYAFSVLGLQKLTAGCYERNAGSKRAFLAAGFEVEGVLKDHWTVNEDLDNEILLGSCNPGIDSYRRFAGLEKLVLIGGGQSMITLATLGQEVGFQVSTIFAPRHAAEVDSSGSKIVDQLKQMGVGVTVVPDINELETIPGAGGSSIAICLGPAWIFKEHVINAFHGRMLNLNLIPSPKYLGGAHFTWQILNGDRSGGCILQEITNRLDRGPILRRHYYQMGEETKCPEDYFARSNSEALSFVRHVLSDLHDGVLFPTLNYAAVESSRLYFPRLLTAQNGWINWRWSADEIARFIMAFDRPYKGAATELDGVVVHLSNVSVEINKDAAFMHPFAAGLVVRKHIGKIWIAVTGGLLCVGTVVDTTGANVMSTIREGRRFHTPIERLEGALLFRPNVLPSSVV